VCATFNHYPGKAAVTQISALAKRARSSTNLRLAVPNFDLINVVIAAVNFTGAENLLFLTARNILCSLKTFGAVGGTISGDPAYTAFP